MHSSLRQSGLEFATADDGTSEWVRSEDVVRFKMEGSALLGKEVKVSDAAKGAHEEARKRLDGLVQQQSTVAAGQESPGQEAGTDLADEGVASGRALEASTGEREAEAARKAATSPAAAASTMSEGVGVGGGGGGDKGSESKNNDNKNLPDKEARGEVREASAISCPSLSTLVICSLQ